MMKVLEFDKPITIPLHGWKTIPKLGLRGRAIVPTQVRTLAVEQDGNRVVCVYAGQRITFKLASTPTNDQELKEAIANVSSTDSATKESKGNSNGGLEW